MGKIPLFLFLFVIIFLIGCTQKSPEQPQAKSAEQYCKELCQAEKAKGTDFSAGPCIGNPINETPDFVCDIAHSPRTAVDNLPENQCSAFREGTAGHFVELDEQCNLIKGY